MKIQVSERTFNKLKKSLKVVETSLDIKIYNNTESDIDICSYCLLRSFEAERISLHNIEFSEKCSCTLKGLYKRI